ncbi:MAG: MBL fold metallo-hydrolase [Gemmatimonadetes bacterium]|nr:MBL fold metallo-hydrolase [Gemmatimonadota bacterium]
MLLNQYYLGCLAHASYFLGDESSGVAAVVDPQRDIDQYIEEAEARNMTIDHVFLTHFHADFAAGHLELRDRTGAMIHLGARAAADYAFEPMRDGGGMDLGRLRLAFLETPGHSPESVCILVYDPEAAASPYAALTGDTLFIGDVGRPDLRAALGWKAEDLADLLYDSLHGKLIPATVDETLVYPAHGAGSLCGKNLSTDTVSTMGDQKKYNYALQPMDRETFTRLITTDQPEAPSYFTYDAAFNAQEHDTLDHLMKRNLNPLSLEEVLRKAEDGAQLLDTRDAADYEGAHLKGSINIGLGGQYASWAGTLLRRDRPIVLITGSGAEEESALRLGRIGFDHIAGYLKGGMHALDERPDLLGRTDRITAAALRDRLDTERPPLVLDIRSGQERAVKSIRGSLHVPLNHLEERMGEIPTGTTVVVQCAGGYRSAMAASILKRNGIADVMDLVGGLAAWEAVQRETAE